MAEMSLGTSAVQFIFLKWFDGNTAPRGLQA